MNPKDFDGSPSGKCLKTLKGYWAFIPNPLPPKLVYKENIIKLLSEADRLLGELSGTGRLLLNPYLLISPYVRREAVSSSRIEGTQASLGDLFFYEASRPEKPKIEDVKEVDNYVKAMEYGIERIKSLPLSTRLICEIHKILMEGVRGQHAAPGELRTSQNWIGKPDCTLNEATFVPPPPEEMKQALSNLEKYLHADTNEPPLLKCALMHSQFETIHPFLDGNGRVGRLLITFFLCGQKYLTQPLLYLSTFFEKNRDEYYSYLLRINQKGDWNGWIEFFLKGMAVQAQDAINDSKKILDLHKTYLEKLRATKKVPDTSIRIIDEIFINPVLSTNVLSKKWDVQFNSVKTGIKRLIEIGILEEATDRKRNKLFVAKELMNLLASHDKVQT